jgi:type IV pilus assembly protein PilV
VSLTKDHGFTLIEVLVSIVILMVGMLGLLQAVNLAIRENLKTVYRTEAVEIADHAMIEQKKKSFALISTHISPNLNRRLYKANVKASMQNYSIVTQGTQLTPRTKEIDITVSWRYRGLRSEHVISSMVSTDE